MDGNNTIPNEIMADYYEQRSSAGLVITEATAISEEGSGWLNAPHICKQEHVQGWKKITDRVHNSSPNGSVIYLQLWHTGRQSHSSYHPSTSRTVAPSATAVQGAMVATPSGDKVPYEVPHALTVDEIQETVQDYVNAASLAQQAGFDGIEVHSANGFLLDTFLQSFTNTRTDQYGGCIENRVRILEEVVQAIIDSGAFPANRIGFRLSPNGVYGDMGSEDNDIMFPFVAKTMSKYGLAYLHLMDGTGFGYHKKCRIVTAHEMKLNFGGPIICNVGLTKDVAEGMIRSGAADMASFGRLYISNPDLPERFANNWPVEPEAGYDTWWPPTAEKGYTDWPKYQN
jgi:N-ethylmaleimide reductase